MRDRVDTRVGRQRPERASLHLSAIAAERLHRASVATGRPMSHLVDEMVAKLPARPEVWTKTARARASLIANPRRTNVVIAAAVGCSEDVVGALRREMEANGELAERHPRSRRAGRKPGQAREKNCCVSVTGAFYDRALAAARARGIPLRQLVEAAVLDRRLPVIGQRAIAIVEQAFDRATGADPWPSPGAERSTERIARPFTCDERADIARRIAAGESGRSVALAIGRHVSSVHRVALSMGLKFPGRGGRPHGSANPERDRQIVDAFKRGETRRAIASAHGISAQRVSVIVARRAP